MRGERRSTNELSGVERRERPEVVSRNGSWRRKTGQRLRNGRQGLVEKAEVGGAKRRRGFKWLQRNWSCEWGRKMGGDWGNLRGKGEIGGPGGVGRGLGGIERGIWGEIGARTGGKWWLCGI